MRNILDIVHDCLSLRDINMVYKNEIEKGELQGGKKTDSLSIKNTSEQPYNEPSSQS